ncbi:hypothetical protein D3C80_1136410 [compost metagenome]
MELAVAIAVGYPLALHIAQALLLRGVQLAHQLLVNPVQPLVLHLRLSLDTFAHGHGTRSLVHALLVTRRVVLRHGQG